VFNNAWVEGQLADLRPDFYGSAFRAWQEAEEGQMRTAKEQLNSSEIEVRGKAQKQIELVNIRLDTIHARSELLNFQQLDGLLLAVKAGHKLKTINSSTLAQGNEKLEVAIALQATVYKIRELVYFKGHSDSVWSVAFSPDGKTIASGSLDTTVI
jgi:WD40 repeat protein